MAAYEKKAVQTSHKGKTSGKTAPKLLRLFALYENLTRFVMPLSTALTDRDFPSTPITQSNNIVDISGVGLKQFWNLRTHMQDASTLATAHYPETLDRIFIIGAPSFFPTVWGWIKRWFDPITTSKIFILSQHEMKATLESFIDPANIPKKYGGELEFNWGDMPVYDPALDDVITWKEGHKSFPHGPMFWHDKGDHIELEAVGSINGEQRREIVATVRKTTIEREAEEAQKAADAAARPATAKAEPSGNLLRVPTIQEAADRQEALEAAQGEVAHADQPEPVSFADATQGVAKLSLQDVGATKPSHVTTPTDDAQFESINEKHAHPGAALRKKLSRTSIGSRESRGSMKRGLGHALGKLHPKRTASKEEL